MMSYLRRCPLIEVSQCNLVMIYRIPLHYFLLFSFKILLTFIETLLSSTTRRLGLRVSDYLYLARGVGWGGSLAIGCSVPTGTQ